MQKHVKTLGGVLHKPKYNVHDVLSQNWQAPRPSGKNPNAWKYMLFIFKFGVRIIPNMFCQIQGPFNL